MTVKLNFDPGETKLTIEVGQYDDKKWRLTVLKSRPDQSPRLAGQLVLDQVDAFQIVRAINGIDPSFNIHLKGHYDLFAAADPMRRDT